MFERIHAPHCSSGLFIVKSHVLDHLLGSLKRFRSYPSTNAEPFGPLNDLGKSFYRTVFQQLSTRMQDTVQNIASAFSSVQRPESKVHGDVAGTSVLSKEESVKNGERHFVRGVLFLPGRRKSKETRRPQAATLAEHSCSEMLNKELLAGSLALFSYCSRKRTCAD